MAFNYLFIFPPCYVALCASKAHHRLGSECFLVFGNFSLFKTPFPGRSSLPTSFVSFFGFYIFSYLFLKTMSCFSGCLMSSASIQKLYCGIYSALKCSFDEFVREKVVSLSYSSAILGPASEFYFRNNFPSKLSGLPSLSFRFPISIQKPDSIQIPEYMFWFLSFMLEDFSI